MEKDTFCHIELVLRKFTGKSEKIIVLASSAVEKWSPHFGDHSTLENVGSHFQYLHLIKFICEVKYMLCCTNVYILQHIQKHKFEKDEVK